MIKPLGDRIVVRPDKVEKTTDSGIVLPDSMKEDAPVTGVVVHGNATVGVDEHIIFSKYGYDEVKVDDEILYLVSTPTVLAIL